ncbi:uncharacterized protein N7477_006133 [Penicillium maclennaniae]|uniref:uncharacterized protein n=1 Tax=Penicillium maclennaniae TaxID=1343394 RepID=UPI002540CD90|nr:uncharacterized protein N7477_006133 [Penicillium maclennaniae]KAJ5670770.1 hypothetical protein N7477_006133 [Penicillium maclennaniae]
MEDSPDKVDRSISYTVTSEKFMGELNRDKGHLWWVSGKRTTRVPKPILTCRRLFGYDGTGSFSSLSKLQVAHIAMKTKTPATARSGLFGDDFRTSKKDKRQIKHATLMSKIAKSSKSQKKRRPSKKLVANLESLADALPDAADESHDAASQANVIKQKTLRHKPGALKRREKLEKVERDRFARNMAQMSGLQTQATESAEPSAESNPTANRWSALRSFISQTMEQQPVFKTTK